MPEIRVCDGAVADKESPLAKNTDGKRRTAT
jgi:hypothetical protein